jgi:transposase
MVWQSEVLSFRQDTIARNLGVDRSTVSRTVNIFRETGGVSKKKYPKDTHYRKLTTPAEMLILNLILKKPGIYLKELQKELLLQLMIFVDIATICRFIHISGFTRQKLCLVALQRDTLLREKYTLDISVYKPEMLIFLDETGADQRNAVRRFGYSLRGMPIQKESLFVRGERVSAIAFISISGVLDLLVRAGTTNGEIFLEFTKKHLLPQLQPFNGVNSNSVIIMDNCTIHHIPEVVEIIQEVGAIVHFLPPYSPDFNPIEMTFSKVKSTIKDLENAMSYGNDIETLLLAAFASISPQDCQGWISHCLK